MGKAGITDALKGACWAETSMFTQILDPTGTLFVTWLVALVPVLLLLFLLAGLRMSAWLAVLIGSIVTFVLGLWVWQMPFGDGLRAYLYGSATGIWNVGWITFWGVMLFNTLVAAGASVSAISPFATRIVGRDKCTGVSVRHSLFATRHLPRSMRGRICLPCAGALCAGLPRSCC
jgi:hypothetical protein